MNLVLNLRVLERAALSREGQTIVLSAEALGEMVAAAVLLEGRSKLLDAINAHITGLEELYCVESDYEGGGPPLAVALGRLAEAAHRIDEGRAGAALVGRLLRRERDQDTMSQLELNKGDNFIFGVDVSASMQATDCPGGLSRIQYLKEKVITFVQEAGKYDDDGIDVITFGHAVTHHPGVSADKAKEIIGKLKANEGATHTHHLIESAYKLHVDGAYKQTVLFVATDGAPSDPGTVKAAIKRIAKQLKDEHEFAISFLTVGTIDSGLRTFLDELDDGLGEPDIVDVKTLEDVDFTAAFSGALHD